MGDLFFWVIVVVVVLVIAIGVTFYSRRKNNEDGGFIQTSEPQTFSKGMTAEEIYAVVSVDIKVISSRGHRPAGTEVTLPHNFNDMDPTAEGMLNARLDDLGNVEHFTHSFKREPIQRTRVLVIRWTTDK